MALDPKPISLVYVDPEDYTGLEPQPFAVVGAAPGGGGEQFTPVATTLAGFDGDGNPTTYARGGVIIDLVTAEEAAEARTAIGAGTSNLALGTTSTTAKAGDYDAEAVIANKTEVAALTAIADTSTATAEDVAVAVNQIIAALQA